MGIIFASLAPVFIILFYIYFRDKYEKEPLGLLGKAVLAGMLMVIPILIVERLLSAFMPPLGKVASAAYNAFLVAGSTEELFKYLALYLLVWKNKRTTQLRVTRGVHYYFVVCHPKSTFSKPQQKTHTKKDQETPFVSKTWLIHIL